MEIKKSICRHGEFSYPSSDEIVGRCLDVYGEFSEGENVVMARFVNPGDTVLDIGANLGTTALPLARAVGKSGRVIAFEPQSEIAKFLMTTLLGNELFNVQVLVAAAGSKLGMCDVPKVDLEKGGNFGGVSLVGKVASTERVPIIRIDDLELQRCGLIKIDVEGFEIEVIRGGWNTILKLNPVLYIEAKKSIPTTKTWLAMLMENGYFCYWHFAAFFRDENYKKNLQNLFPNIGDMNVLAVPSKFNQPENLPLIKNPDEDWANTYASFFVHRGIPRP